VRYCQRWLNLCGRLHMWYTLCVCCVLVLLVGAVLASMVTHTAWCGSRDMPRRRQHRRETYQIHEDVEETSTNTHAFHIISTRCWIGCICCGIKMAHRNATCVRTKVFQVGAIIVIAHMLVMLSLHMGIVHCTSTGLSHSRRPIVVELC
jgi:hypothetical protein